MLEREVVVVGGGPSGAAAAITAARAGRQVTLVDKATFPRDKCCGDGLTAGALRLLEQLGLDPAMVPSWHVVDDVVVRSPSGREGTFALPANDGQYAVVARRADLDAALVDVARRAGVEVLDGHACIAATAHADAIVVEIENVGPIASRYVIGADGMWSPLRKHLGVADSSYRGEWHAFRQYFTDVGPRAARELFVWFEPDLLPGYAWSFPLPDNRANVGYCIIRSEHLDGKALKQLWPDLLDRPHIRDVLGPHFQPERPHKAWPIPARVDRSRLTAGRALFVGDAVRATDPMTGEGIGQALLGGMLAADAVVAAGPLDPVGAARRYREGVRSELIADHRMALVMGRGLRHRKGARAAVRLADHNDWTRRNFARWLFEDYPRAMAVTPGRWHAGVFHGRGAYRDRDRAGRTA
ncbi:MAG: geranylgeranyl reductase family protein [Acidimicrobiales bacterium]